MASTVEYIPNLLIGLEWGHSPEALAIVATIGQGVARTASQMAPVRTGRLSQSIDSTAHGISEVANAEILADTEYAGYVEFGTSDTPAQPYLRPALDAVMKGA